MLTFSQKPERKFHRANLVYTSLATPEFYRIFTEPREDFEGPGGLTYSPEPLETASQYLTSCSPGSLGGGSTFSSNEDTMSSSGHQRDSPVETKLSSCDASLEAEERGEPMESDSPALATTRRNPVGNQQLSHPCGECGKRFASEGKLMMHVKRVHSTDRPHVCGVCGKAFAIKAFLSKHELCHSKPFRCGQCGKSFASKTLQVDHHLYVHSADRPHACSTCGKSYATAKALTKHRLLHSGGQPHICSACNKTYSTKADLTAHFKRMHSEEQRYPCEVCSKTFSFRHALLKHELVHSRPFTCADCGKSFARKSSLSNHLRVHSRKAFPNQSFPEGSYGKENVGKSI